MPTGVITGRIYDENRRSLRAMRVEAVRFEYRDGGRSLTSAGQAQSDDRGEYRIFNLQPATYYVRVTQGPPAVLPRSPPTFAAIYYPGVIDPQDAVAVTVASGAEIQAIDLSVIKIPTFSVVVTLVSDVPLDRPAATFLAMRRDRRILEPVTLPAEQLGAARFRVSGLPPGAYDIFAQLRAAAAGVVQTGQIGVSIRSEDVDAGALPVRAGVTISGNIRTDSPVTMLDPQKITVSLKPIDGQPAFGPGSRGPSAIVSEDGTFIIRAVPPGRFHIAVAGLPPSLNMVSARYGGRDVINAGIDVYGDTQGSLELMLGGLQSLGAIEGVVRNAGNRPAADSIVARIHVAAKLAGPLEESSRYR
jgi:hypothetical protein